MRRLLRVTVLTTLWSACAFAFGYWNLQKNGDISNTYLSTLLVFTFPLVIVCFWAVDVAIDRYALIKGKEVLRNLSNFAFSTIVSPIPIVLVFLVFLLNYAVTQGHI